MGMGRPHAPEVNTKYYQTGLDMEPPGQEEKRPTKEYMAKRPSGRHQENGIHLETAQDRVTWRTVIDGLCLRKG